MILNISDYFNMHYLFVIEGIELNFTFYWVIKLYLTNNVPDPNPDPIFADIRILIELLCCSHKRIYCLALFEEKSRG